MADVSTIQAATLNIKCYKGDTFALSLVIKDSAGAAINVTGYDFKMQVRAKESETSAEIMLFENGTGIDVSGAATGTILLTKTAVEMNVPAKVYFYDLQYTKPTGEVTTVLVGKFTVQLEITTA